MNVYQQNNPVYFDELKQLISNYPKHYSIMLSHSKKYLFEWIDGQLPVLDNTFKICTKCYWVLNGFTDFPKCLHCGKPIIQKNIQIMQKHKVFCSNRCSTRSEYRKEKIKQTCLEKYGVENVFQDKACKDKIQQTCISRYGVNNPSQSADVKKKKEQTFLVRYGVKNISQTNEYKQKFRQTCLEKYGVENPFQSEIVKNISKQTCIKIYGVQYYTQSHEFSEQSKKTCLTKYGKENYAQTDEYKQKYKQTCLERYGVENSSQAVEVREKSKQTCLRKYGVEHPSQCHDIRLKQQRRYTYNGIRFDSAPELAFYIYLTDTNADFEYQPDISFVYAFDGKTHRYFPDFRVNGELIELKGGQFLAENGGWQCPWDHSLDGLYEAKRRCLVDNNVRILYPADYRKYEDLIN